MATTETEPVAPRSPRLRRLARAAVADRVLVLIVVLAAIVRGVVMALYAPAVQQWGDATRFARTQQWTDFFSDFWMPAGYPSVLAVLRTICDELVFTIGAQHALGIVSGLLLVAAARRFGVPRPYHYLAGVVVWFGGDFIYFEHVLMTETLFIFCFSLCIYCTARSLQQQAGSVRWLLFAELAAAATTLVRWNALFVLALPLLTAVVRGGPAWRQRVRTLALAAAPAVLLLGSYVAFSSWQGYSGTTDMNGWILYSRVGPFLDCNQTSADDDHPLVCESTAPATRLGPLYYSWVPSSPGRQAFPLTTDSSDDLMRLGIDAIVHQPVAYARDVSTDIVRLFFWSFHHRDGSGQMLKVYDFDYRDPAVEERIADALSSKYDGAYVNARSVHLLHNYQMLTRVRGWMMLLLTLVGAAAIVGAPRGRRTPALFVGAIVAGLWLLPILTLTWDFRYALPGTAIVPLLALLLLPIRQARRDRLALGLDDESDLGSAGGDEHLPAHDAPEGANA